MNRIQLTVDEKKHGILTGNPEGIKVFNEQVSNKFNWNELNEIILPDEVKWVSLSFIQGFCSSVFKKYGKNNVHQYIKFFSENPYVLSQIERSIPLL